MTHQQTRSHVRFILVVLATIFSMVFAACGDSQPASQPVPTDQPAESAPTRPPATTLSTNETTQEPDETQDTDEAQDTDETPAPEEDTDQDDLASSEKGAYDNSDYYEHPSEAFNLYIPTNSDITEFDEGVDVIINDTTMLGVYSYESDEDINDDTAEEETDILLDEFLLEAEIADDYELYTVEGDYYDGYISEFGFTIDDDTEGNGWFWLYQEDETTYVMMLLAEDIDSVADVWDIAIESFSTTASEEDESDEDVAEEDESDEDVVNQEDEEADDASTSEGATWLIMLYSDADDQILEEDMFIDLNEIERVGSTDEVQIVAQMDRYKGAFKGDGNWTSAKRYYMTQDDDLSTINSEELDDLGEVNMGDEDTLVDFVSWAANTYPADNYVLIFSDHGAGWPGGWNDPDPPGEGRHGTSMDEDEDMLLLTEIDSALNRILEETDIDMFEIIGYDACLMSHIEVFTAMAPYARYSVASQETEPSMGWAYEAFLGQLVENPDMDGAELSEHIVASYINDDVRIANDDARQEFLEAIGARSSFSAEEVAEFFGEEITLTAADLSAMPELLRSLDSLIEAMATIDPEIVAEARAYAQSFSHVFGDEIPSSYIDLGHFAAMVARESEDETVEATVDEVIVAIENLVIAEKHGPERPGATGVSIYFPTSELYTETDVGGYEMYTFAADRFVAESQWDNFLASHYTGEALGNNILTAASRFVAPGASEITMTPLELSAEEATNEDTVTIYTEISGQNIGFIYFYLGYYDEESNAILVADMDFIEADDTQEVNGVTYPAWGDEETIPIDFDWTPTVYEITDGTTSVFALLDPETYGDTDEDTTFVVEGIYTFVEDGEERYADLIFDGTGELRKVIGYTGDDGTGAPRQITPHDGDTFTVLEQWYQLSEDGEEEIEFYEEEGDTLTFGDMPFTWDAVDAPIGAYEVGFIAEDLDGNYYEEYAEIEVVE